MENVFDLLWLSYPATLVSLIVSTLIVLTKGYHIHLTAKGHAGLEIQSSHNIPTPRIGGVAFVAGLLSTLWLLDPPARALLIPMLGAAIPVIFAGLAEDIGIGASPKQRLLAAMFSSFVMIVFSGYFIRSGVAPGLDFLIGYAVIGGLFTIFITGAVCHAFNLVDGLNGLAMSIAFLASCALGLIALQVGDVPVAYLAGAIAASIVGVFALNFPLGKIFLGDAGAYSIGFLIAWTGVLLLARNPEVSKWSVLLAFFWPFMDTTAAVLHRIRKKVPVGKPDKLHFHHVMKRVIDASLSETQNNTVANPLATVAMLPFIALAPVLGVLTAQNTSASLVALAISIAMYFAIKIAVIKNFKRISRAKTEMSISRGKPMRPHVATLGANRNASPEKQPSQRAA